MIDSSVIIPASLTMPVLALSGAGVLGTIINEKVKKNHQKSINTYASVISSLGELKEMVPTEKNILSNLSDSCSKSLANEQALENAHLVSNAFNINWVDHMSKEDKTKLQEQIKIYQGLHDTVEIVSPDHMSKEDKTKLQEQIKIYQELQEAAQSVLQKTKKRVPNSEK